MTSLRSKIENNIGKMMIKIQIGFRKSNDNVRQTIPEIIYNDENRWIPWDLKIEKIGTLDNVETIIHSPIVKDEGANFMRIVKTNKLRKTDTEMIEIVGNVIKFTVVYGKIEYTLQIEIIIINDNTGESFISIVGTPLRLRIKRMSKIIDTIMHMWNVFVSRDPSAAGIANDPHTIPSPAPCLKFLRIFKQRWIHVKTKCNKRNPAST